MIPPGPRNGQMRLLAAIFLLLIAASSLYGRGAREDTVLSRADQLMEEKQYDEAVQILSDFIKENPDRADEAQKRLKKIIKIRERYTEIANQLLDVVESDPDNSDKILKLSNELLAIESPSNPATRRFLNQVRYLAEFRVNSRRLQQILVQASGQLAQDDYSAALATYASGLDIYQDLYFSSGYGEEAENTASSGLENISRNISGFNAIAGPIKFRSDILTASDSPDPPLPAETARAFTEISPFLDELSGYYESFHQVKNSFETQRVINQRENDEIGDRSFLSFAGTLITGPPEKNEGMIGALRKFWSNQIGSAESSLVSLVNRYYSSGLQAVLNQNYSGGISIFNTTDQYITPAMELIRKSNSFLGIDESPSYMLYGEQVNQDKAGQYLALRVMNHALAHFRIAGDIAVRDQAIERGGFTSLASWQQGAVTSQAAITQEQAIRRSYQGLINELTVLIDRIAAELETYRYYGENLSVISANLGTPQKPLNDVRDLAASLNSRLKTMEYNSAVRRYSISTMELEARVSQREGEFMEGNSLIQGIDTATDWGETYTAYYPTEGLAALTAMNSKAEADVRDSRALIALFTSENQTTLGAEEMNRLYSQSRDQLARLLALQSNSAGLMAAARERIQRAASLRYEGDRLFQAAQASLNRIDFEGARNNLTRAADQYRASRAIQESESLRNIWDTQVVKLNEDIDRRENEVIVQYVREQLTRAQTLYFAGNIDQAETALVNAQNRWRITNTTEQPEVEYWLGLVRGAQSLQSGRSIAATAPLFSEMSQLLSDARLNYDEGVRLLNSGRRTEGLVRFNDAMEKTREVRLMFPLNHDARMLELRIEQQTDIGVFNASFQRRLNEAISGTRPNVRSMQSFAELQDLAEINPRFPGIAAILNQAEIDMGFRPPPPNPRDLARSAELTRSAEANYNSRDTTRYSLARTELEEAIRLNPNNSQAQRLLDQVMISTTGIGTIAIPRDVQDQYDVAFRMHTQGNYLQADAILQRLLQVQSNQKYTIIHELKRRNDPYL